LYLPKIKDGVIINNNKFAVEILITAFVGVFTNKNNDLLLVRRPTTAKNQFY